MQAEFVIKNLPMPPSSNNMYKTIYAKGRSFKAPSKEFVEFKKKIAIYCEFNRREIKLIAEQLGPLLSINYMISIERYFFFKKKSLFTQKFTVKRMDVANREKPIDDAIAEMINIDDRFFWAGYSEKIEMIDDDDEGAVEFVNIVLRLKKTRVGELNGDIRS